jgi:hypothetical protein
MERLLAGQPRHTDGRLIKDNLWKEAQVSRATMNRARQVMTEWQARVAACGAKTHHQARDAAELAGLRAKLAEKTHQSTQLRHKLDAAATVIAALHHDNILLREALSRQGTLIRLDDHRPHP